METYITIGIAILLGAIVLKVAWNSLKAAIKLVAIIAIAALGLHYFAPDVLNKVISPDQKEEVVNTVDSLKHKTEEKFVEIIGDAVNSQTK